MPNQIEVSVPEADALARNEHHNERHAEYDAWKLSMRAAGRALPSDSGANVDTLHSDDITSISPTQAQRAAVLAHHAAKEWGTFDERAICLSKVYVTVDLDSAKRRNANDLTDRIRASAEYREPPEKKSKGKIFFVPPPDEDEDEVDVAA